MMKMHLVGVCELKEYCQIVKLSSKVIFMNDSSVLHQGEVLLLAVLESAHWFIYYIKIWAHIPPPLVFIYGIYR